MVAATMRQRAFLVTVMGLDLSKSNASRINLAIRLILLATSESAFTVLRRSVTKVSGMPILQQSRAARWLLVPVALSLVGARDRRYLGQS